jgi:hypothetical protein
MWPIIITLKCRFHYVLAPSVNKILTIEANCEKIYLKFEINFEWKKKIKIQYVPLLGSLKKIISIKSHSSRALSIILIMHFIFH